MQTSNWILRRAHNDKQRPRPPSVRSHVAHSNWQRPGQTKMTFSDGSPAPLVIVRLDVSSCGQRASAVSSFVANTPFSASYPTALAIYCSDGRFTEAVEELLHHLGHKRLDTLTLPGGPGLLNPWSAGGSVLDSEHVMRSAQMLIKNHGITEVVLLAHAGCGHYKLRYPLHSPEDIKKSQIADLAVAAKALDSDALRIHQYWLQPEGDRVHFELLAEPI
jgi:hypothetical protein